jgi:signal transduction histidine kinase
MAKFFRLLKQYDSSYYYYQKALIVCQQNGNKIEEAGILDGFAEYFADRNDYQQAIAYSLQAKEIWQATGAAYEEAINNTGLTGYYYLMLAKQQNGFPKSARAANMLQTAQRLLQEAVQKNKEASNKNSEAAFENHLSKVYSITGNYKEALASYIHYRQITDSIYSQENKNKIAASIGQFELEKKNNEIALHQLTIANQQRQQFFYIGGLVLFAVIGGLLFWQNRTRKKNNSTLLVLNNQLDDANKVKAKFFAILSHDLRGPVAKLISFLRLQKEDPDLLSPLQIADNQQKITRSAESLFETMEAMLLWSKGQMDNFTPEIKSVPVSRLFAYLKTFFEDTEQIQLSFEDPGALTVQSDENYLQTIMQNLTANAIKALRNTPEASIQWKLVQEGDRTLLSISDNGPGIKEEQARALYDDEAMPNGKYGLGLYLIRDLAKSIHCKISLQTRTGAGTTFTLLI